MRVIALIALSTVLSASNGYSDRQTLDQTKTQMALRLSDPPIIDGIIDIPGEESWIRAGGSIGANNQSYWHVRPDARFEDGIRGGTSGDGAPNPPVSDSDLRFDVWAGFDETNLYIAVRVRDDVLVSDSAEAGSQNGSTWLDDSVEIFIDGDNSNFESRDTTGSNPEVIGSGGQFVITVNNAYREAEAGNPGFGANAAWFAKTEKMLDVEGNELGYEAEFRIALSALGNPKEGDIIGFTVSVNDDDDDGPAERQMIWVGSPHTEATYGNLILGNTRSYDAPKVSTAPTIDGVVNPSEYAGAQEIKVDVFNAIYDIPSGDDTFEPGDHGYSAWIVHDSEAIYVGYDVIDDVVVTDSAEPGSEDGSTWEDDSVEIIFDADHSHDLGRGLGQFEGQFVFTANGAWRDNESNNPQFGQNGDWFAATKTTARGYQVEFKVKKSALFNPEDGAVLGYHLDQNDDDGEGRKGQPGWSGRAHNEFTYGHLRLLAASNGGGGGGTLRISGIATTANGIDLTVSSAEPPARHVLQKTSALGNGTWADVAGATFSAAGAGTVKTSIATPAASPEFYRVVVR